MTHIHHTALEEGTPGQKQRKEAFFTLARARRLKAVPFDFATAYQLPDFHSSAVHPQITPLRYTHRGGTFAIKTPTRRRVPHQTYTAMFRPMQGLTIALVAYAATAFVVPGATRQSTTWVGRPAPVVGVATEGMRPCTVSQPVSSQVQTLSQTPVLLVWFTGNARGLSVTMQGEQGD